MALWIKYLMCYDMWPNPLPGPIVHFCVNPNTLVTIG